jgi:hypothetical protein
VPGLWNERLGWLLLLAGLCTAVGLDPWSLRERDPAAIPGSARMAARQAQAVVLAMGFLQIAAALLLREATRSARLRNLAGWVLGAGTLLYAAGYLFLALGSGSTGLIFWGAVVNLIGFVLLSRALWHPSVAVEVRAVLAIFLFGMALDAVNSLYVHGWSRLLIDLGPEDGIRLRMLRLARVAVTALSLLTLLSRDHTSARAADTWDRWGRLGLVIGTVGMPTVLAGASFLQRDLKYLLPIPALAMTGGVTFVLLRARRTALRLEQYGWLLVVLSMSVGLVIGLYAFDGPLPTPAFVGPYNAFARRLVRLGHAYAIVFGLLAILLARQGCGRLATGLFLAGNGATVAAIVLLAFLHPPTAILGVGPGLIVLALLAGIHWGVPRKKARDNLLEKVPAREGNRTPQGEGTS